MKHTHKQVRQQVKRLAHGLQAWYDVKDQAQHNIERIRREIHQLKQGSGHQLEEET